MALEPSRAIDRLLPETAVRRYLLILALVFTAAVPAGMYVSLPGTANLADALKTVAGQSIDMAGGTLFLFILLNNLFASLLLLLSGLLAGVVPVLSVILNGFLLGLVFRLSSEAIGLREAVLSVMPHALFEIPALLVAASYGVWLGAAVIRRLRKKETEPIDAMVNRAFERYFSLVLPLLVVAAAIETGMILRGK